MFFTKTIVTILYAIKTNYTSNISENKKIEIRSEGSTTIRSTFISTPSASVGCLANVCIFCNKYRRKVN